MQVRIMGESVYLRSSWPFRTMQSTAVAARCLQAPGMNTFRAWKDCRKLTDRCRDAASEMPHHRYVENSCSEK